MTATSLAIFCRNLLIYFDRPTQEGVLKKMHRLLAAQGIFFIGHAESGCVNSALFSLIRQEGTFAYRKRIETKEISIAISSGDGARSKSKRKSGAKYSIYAPTASPGKVVKNTATEIIPNEANILIQATELVDRGELEEAARLCEKHLELAPYSAATYYLLGVIREAQGNVLLGRDLFHKALYLDPKHYQALIHLAEQAERQGDVGVAATYRARAQRLSETETI